MDDNKKSERPKEQDAVFTTIVGGRPPGSGTKVGAIPRGIEVLVKKASVDPEFRQILLEKRGEAAKEIELELTEAERNTLSSIPAEQLEKIIDNTKVKPEHKAIFLGNVGKLMLAAVVTVALVSVVMVPSLGHTSKIAQERIRQMQMEQPGDVNDVNEPNEIDVDSEDLGQALISTDEQQLGEDYDEPNKTDEEN
jgi:hypothetical protein